MCLSRGKILKSIDEGSVRFVLQFLGTLESKETAWFAYFFITLILFKNIPLRASLRGYHQSEKLKLPKGRFACINSLVS